MTTKIYTQSGCGSCIATKRTFDKLGVDYELVDVTNDDGQREYLRSQYDFQQMPIIETMAGAWSGYQPDRIKELAQEQKDD